MQRKPNCFHLLTVVVVVDSWLSKQRLWFCFATAMWLVYGKVSFGSYKTAKKKSLKTKNNDEVVVSVCQVLCRRLGQKGHSSSTISFILSI